MCLKLNYRFSDIASLENLLEAWREFVRGKRGKADVQAFSTRFIDNIVQLHNDLTAGTYRHGGYERFTVSDPKPRIIHKASVRDRFLHHAVHRILYPCFDRTFIADTFSCRLGKGTHRALERFRRFGYRVSKNHTRTGWVLKCDIKKFFDSVDHNILLGLLETHIPDEQIMQLLDEIIRSFPFGSAQDRSVTAGTGLPLGNLTSQLFANVYLNPLDQFIKHRLRARCYVRYCDDFVVLSDDRDWLEQLIPAIAAFLRERLHLSLHPNKVFIKTLASGVDFLGWVHFPNHRVLRTATKRRMFRRIKKNPTPATLQSYLGLIGHGNTHKVKQELLNRYGLWVNEI